MSFQGPNNRPKTPSLWHSQLVKQPRLVTVKSLKFIQKLDKFVAELIIEGVEHAYWINKPEIKASLDPYIGQQVVLIGSGNDKQGTETLEVQSAGVSGATIPQPTTNKWAAAAPVTQQPTQHAPVPTQPVHVPPQALHGGERAAKQFLCQASNLMRLCVKKAHDIMVEFGLPEEHRQGISTTLFIQADRAGHIAGMPIQPFTLEQLGVVARQEPRTATEVVNQQAQEEEDQSIPF
jgi:hypothetical protein